MPRLALLALLLAGALLAPAALVLADDAGDEPAEHGKPEGRGQGKGEDLRAVSKEQRAERESFRAQMEERRAACEAMNGTARAECQRRLQEEREDFDEDQRAEFRTARDAAGPRLGRFALAADNGFQGRFVSFQWDAASASVLQYTVGGCVVFDRIQLRGLDADQENELEVEAHGRVVHVEAGDARLRLHDNPGGVIAARAAPGGSVGFTPAAGLAVKDEGYAFSLGGCGDLHADVGGPNMTLQGGVLSAPRHATFVAKEPHPALPEVAKDRADVAKAKAERRLGAEVTVLGEGADDVEEVALDPALRLETRRGHGSLTVVVNGTGTEPRTIALNVAPGLLQGGKVLVTYYDQAAGALVEARIVQASNRSDALDPSDDGGVAEYWVDHGAHGTQVLVSIPRWSVHAFQVQGVLEVVPPNVLAGALGAVLFVAVAGAGLVRRRKR